MAWHQSGDKPLSEAMVVSLLTHICVTGPQWVKKTTWCSPHFVSANKISVYSIILPLNIIPIFVPICIEYHSWDMKRHKANSISFDNNCVCGVRFSRSLLNNSWQQLTHNCHGTLLLSDVLTEIEACISIFISSCGCYHSFSRSWMGHDIPLCYVNVITCLFPNLNAGDMAEYIDLIECITIFTFISYSVFPNTVNCHFNAF